MYEGVRANLINGFFNRHYKYTCCARKQGVIESMNIYMPFPMTYKDDILTVDVGDNIKLDFKLTWEEKSTLNKIINKETPYYRLINIE